MPKSSYVDSSVHILGARQVEIGENCCISEGVWLNVNHRSDKREPSLVIASNSFIGKRNFFTCGASIRIGSHVLTSVDCKFLGSAHDYSNPLEPALHSAPTSSDHIRVGHGVFIGASAMVIGSVVVGHGAVVGAGSSVISDVPPFSLVVGAPARIIKRYSFAECRWKLVDLFTEDDERSLLSENSYLEQLNDRYAMKEMPWIAASRRLGNL
ncbi:acyltransferase [Pseudacidovorax intermedius]|uniref:acyltransferase n=1 Tax=Pseudacidovorax intermedius TaxID=433924 RepID=UPI00187C5151|nr:hypothetical protein [Pseudacidovorax intermedius]